VTLKSLKNRVLILGVVFSISLAALSSNAAPGETNDFSKAARLFESQIYNLAETGFSNFVAVYTNSVHRPLAILFEARARYYQSNYVGAIELLQTNMASANGQADEYQFWVAESLFRKPDYRAAADRFGILLQKFPNSAHRLDAAFSQAKAYAQLNDWPKVIELLQNPEGAFQAAAAQHSDNVNATDGFLLLGTALFNEHRNADAEQVVRAMRIDPSNKKANWERYYLLCRVQFAAGKTESALLNTVTMLKAATGERVWMAESKFLEGQIFEKLDRVADALQSYTNNLGEDVPTHILRQSLFKTVDLMEKLGHTDEAIKRLVTFIDQRPQDPALDVARLSLGELDLKAFDAARTNASPDVAISSTNLLLLAQTNFDHVLVDFTNSPLRGKAFLDRGWCDWLQGRIPQAQTNFAEAVRLLPKSEDRAIARFKLADTQYAQTNYAAALTNYNIVVDSAQSMPSLKEGLLDHALYQVVRCSIAAGDEKSASVAADKIQSLYPNSLFADRALLLFGEDLNRLRNYAQARKAFSDLLQKFPNTTVRPQVQLAIAQSFAQENLWQDAAAQYDQWVAKFPQHPLLPQAEFCRALAYDKAGNATNAFVLFTNFVARFPSNTFAPWAQNWVADAYFNQDAYVPAEKAYQELYQKYPASGDLAFQARLMAGRAALAGQRPAEASDYLLQLMNDTNAPVDVVTKAHFAFGDAKMQQFQDSLKDPKDASSTNYFDEAHASFHWITTLPPTNASVSLAYGRLGDCYWAWATNKNSAAQFDQAISNYIAAAAMPLATLETRSQAEVGIGRCYEAEGQLDLAMEHYCKVIPDFSDDPNRFSAFWAKEAAVRAAAVFESQQQWDKAVNIYARVKNLFPALQSTLDKKIAAAQQHKTATKN
jgi:TolA-binding protein